MFRRRLHPLAIAAGTLTILRIPIRAEVTPDDLGASTAFYPLVGAGIGTCVATCLILPIAPSVRAALALVIWVVLTGALHLDGWADCCDAAFAPDRGNHPSVKEWRLGILKDPHIGTFGVVGLGLLLLCKWITLTQVDPIAPIAAAATARFAIVNVMARHRSARENGLVAAFAGRHARGTAIVILLVILTVAIVSRGSFIPIVASALLALVATEVLATTLDRRFGGITGDVCGAVAECAELVTLFTFVLLPK